VFFWLPSVFDPKPRMNIVEDIPFVLFDSIFVL
jgi:hypothetical protein